MSSFKQYLRFLLAAIRLCVSNLPLKFPASAGAFAVSRLTQTIALFLPIKILLLLSGSSAPSILKYIPLEPDVTIMLLMVGVPVLYAATILLAAWFQWQMDAVNVPKSNIAGVQISSKQYKRLHEAMARQLADFLILLLGLLGILVFSWPFALATVVLLGLYGLSMELMIFRRSQTRHTILRLTHTQLFEYGRTITFITLSGALALLVVHFRVNVYLAILAMLMARLMTQAAQRLFSSAYKHRRTYANWIAATLPQSSVKEGCVLPDRG